MGRTVYLHAYVAKEVTPTVADEINGPTVGVDEDELKRDPEGVKQRMIEDFINWLKGKPDLEEFVEIKGSSELYRAQDEPRTPSRLAIAEKVAARKQEKKAGLVAEFKGIIVRVLGGKNTGQIVYTDRKTGRFVSRKRWEEL